MNWVYHPHSSHSMVAAGHQDGEGITNRETELPGQKEHRSSDFSSNQYFNWNTHKKTVFYHHPNLKKKVYIFARS